MPNWQWASIFHAPTFVLATTTATGYSAARVGILDGHPLIRTWRSTSTIEQDVILDLGVLRNVAAMAVLNVNSSHYSGGVVSQMASPIRFSLPHHTGSSGCRWVPQVHVVHTGSCAMCLVRFPAQPPSDLGAPYFEMGQVVVAETL